MEIGNRLFWDWVSRLKEISVKGTCSYIEDLKKRIAQGVEEIAALKGHIFKLSQHGVEAGCLVFWP